MRAIRAQKWQLSVADGSALLRERYLEIDTIPKPCGLRSDSPLSGLYVPDVSRICPSFVPVLSRFCPAFVPPHFALRRTHGRQVSRCSEQRRR